MTNDNSNFGKWSRRDMLRGLAGIPILGIRVVCRCPHHRQCKKRKTATAGDIKYQGITATTYRPYVR